MKPIGASEWDGRKAPSDIPFLSHSSVPKVLHSDVLENWMLNRLAEGAIENLGTVSRLAAGGDIDGARKTILDSRWAKRPGSNMSEAERGTFLHSVMEHWLEGEHAPPMPAGEEALLEPMQNQIRDWLVLHAPECVATELVVYNDYTLTAGRGDMWVRFRRGPVADKYGTEKVWHLDLKTAADPQTGRGYDKKPYADSVNLQLAGGRWAEGYATFEPRIKKGYSYGGRAYLLNSAEREVLKPLVDLVGPPEEMGTAVVHVTPLWARTWEAETGLEVRERVKEIRGAWLWKNFESKNALHPYAEGEVA